jgi:hypothetical protein
VFVLALSRATIITVEILIAVVILIVLIAVMASRKPGPDARAGKDLDKDMDE